MDYLQDCQTPGDVSHTQHDLCLDFWLKHGANYPRTFKLAKKVLSVPASSAPIERVFSQSGLIMRPHRSQLSDQLLSDLILLKCNKMPSANVA